MPVFSEELLSFFRLHQFGIFTTIDSDGYPHSACKDIIEIYADGRIFLLDVYHGKTFANLKANPYASFTVVDEHKFKGYCLKGLAKIAEGETLSESVLKAWESRISQRITQRLLRNLAGEKGHPRHPEAMLPRPKYLIEFDIREIIDLAPRHIEQGPFHN